MYIYIIVVAVFCYALLKRLTATSIPAGFRDLPGPIGLPLIGNLASINGPLYHHLYETSKVYGPIFSFTMGCRKIIVMNSHKILTKTFKEMGYSFSGRWQNIWVKITNLDSGILFKDKEWWSIQRKFITKVLKNFGLGKQISNEIVNHECMILMKDIEDKCGQVVNTKRLFPKATVNVIGKLVMNMRFETDDKGFILMINLIEKILHKNNFMLFVILMYPILENFPRFSKFLLSCSGINQDTDILHNFFKEIIDEHRKRFSPESEGEDLIDMFLKEQYQLEKDNVKDHTYTNDQLIRVVFELFGAGYDTTSSTLEWSMVVMAKYPEIQEKVYQELLHNIGSNRLPNMTDKRSLTYTQAVMDEINRFGSVAPLGIPHRVLENTEVNGFFIPKDSIVFPNFYGCHRNENIWERPFEFYPQHFLKTIDNGNVEYTPRDELLAFGLGKRQCIGDSLARTELFVFFTSILQRFTVRFEKQMGDEILQGTDGSIRTPLCSEVIFEKR